MKVLFKLTAAVPPALATLIAFATEASAATRRVPDAYPTIQAAIDAAVDGDVVQVRAGVYRESIRWESKAIRLVGAGSAATILNPGAGPGGRCLTLVNVPASARIERLTCRDGRADTGGGALVQGGAPTFSRVVFRNNTALSGPGGGVRVDSGTVSLDQCVFQNNSAPRGTGGFPGGGLYAGPFSTVNAAGSIFRNNVALRGGGLTVERETLATLRNVLFQENTGGLFLGIDGSADVSGSAFQRNRERGGVEGNFFLNLTVADSVFVENSSAGRGGGLTARLGTLDVRRSVFAYNTAATVGGGLALFEQTSTVSDSWFVGNEATIDGGGIGIAIGDNVIERCQFYDNAAGGNGGGMSAVSDSFTTVSRSIFNGNRAAVSGGGMFAGTVIGVEWNDCAFSDNEAGTFGGGVAVLGFYNYARMINSTITRNTAGEAGGGLYLRGDGEATVLNSIVWNNDPDQIFVAASPFLTVAVTYSDVQGGFAGVGNINRDPLFVAPSAGDLRIRRDSPARDAGFDDGSLPETDLAGNPRVIGPAPDMGAYEVTTGVP